MNDLSSTLGLYSLIRKFTPVVLMLFTISMTFLNLVVLISIWNINHIKSIALAKATRRGRLFLRPSFKFFLKALYRNFDLIFSICVLLGCGNMSCRWSEIDEEGSGEASALLGSFSSEFVSAIDVGISLNKNSYHVNFLHDDINCLSNNDLILKFTSIILLLCSFSLRFIFQKLKTIEKNKSKRDTCINNSPIVSDILITFSMAVIHIMTVVLPRNRTPEQVAELKANSDSKRVL